MNARGAVAVTRLDWTDGYYVVTGHMSFSRDGTLAVRRQERDILKRNRRVQSQDFMDEGVHWRSSMSFSVSKLRVPSGTKKLSSQYSQLPKPSADIPAEKGSCSISCAIFVMHSGYIARQYTQLVIAAAVYDIRKKLRKRIRRRASQLTVSLAATSILMISSSIAFESYE